jgi:hypothetical protein
MYVCMYVCAYEQLNVYMYVCMYSLMRRVAAVA